MQTAGEYEEIAAAEAAEAFLAEELPEHVFGCPKAGAKMWASCLRVMHPTEVCLQTEDCAMYTFCSNRSSCYVCCCYDNLLGQYS